MNAKQFLEQIKNNLNIKDYYFISNYPIYLGRVPNTYTPKNYGYYPHKIEDFSFSITGKIKFITTLVNNLGTTCEDSDYFIPNKIIKFSFNRYFEFFDNELDAIEECHLRNRGKAGYLNENMEETKKNYPDYVADIFY